MNKLDEEKNGQDSRGGRDGNFLRGESNKERSWPKEVSCGTSPSSNFKEKEGSRRSRGRGGGKGSMNERVRPVNREVDYYLSNIDLKQKNDE